MQISGFIGSLVRGILGYAETTVAAGRIQFPTRRDTAAYVRCKDTYVGW
jgi:hypothetical protein